MKLHIASLLHAVVHDDGVPPPPVGAGAPAAGLGVMLVRHAGSQIDVCAHAVKSSI